MFENTEVKKNWVQVQLTYAFPVDHYLVQLTSGFGSIPM